MDLDYTGPNADRPRWRENAPFFALHAVAIGGAIMVGWSWAAFAWFAGSYAVRMFAITGGLHRYFSHRTFKTGRVFQFVLAFLAMSTAQQGPLWWAAHHRRHHKESDTPNDLHSPRQRGFYWSHVGWILSSRHRATDYAKIKDFAKYPELVFLNRHDMAFVVGYGALTMLVGGPIGFVWGFMMSIVVTWHATFCINSLAHVLGRRRYDTSDDSRNNGVLALLTFGEGWHNNHHHYQRSARQGFFWWEVDLTYYVLKGLEALHVVRDVAGVPRHVRDAVMPAPGSDLLSSTNKVPVITGRLP
ncbi:MAG: acyl-CoA desaturase [Proteobacteria bacterium]|nr:acyl-CoA desaturase [Pseudomonadota bacterium]